MQTEATSPMLNSASPMFFRRMFWASVVTDRYIWVTLPIATAEVFPPSCPCGGATASLFYLQNPVQKYGCLPQTWGMTTKSECLRWPEHTWRVESDDFTAYVQCSRGRSAAGSPLTLKCQTSLRCKWTSGWLLTRRDYLARISRHLTKEYHGIQQSSQKSSNPMDIPVKNANSFLPHLIPNLDEAF